MRVKRLWFTECSRGRADEGGTVSPSRPVEGSASPPAPAARPVTPLRHGFVSPYSCHAPCTRMDFYLFTSDVLKVK